MGIAPELEKNDDFLITFFVGEKCYTKSLNYIVKNADNNEFWRELGISAGFVFPIIQKEVNGHWNYALQRSKQLHISLNFKSFLMEEYLLQHGDYITFYNTETNFNVSVLLRKSRLIKLAYEKYFVANNTSLSIGFSQSDDLVNTICKNFASSSVARLNIDNQGKAIVQKVGDISLYVNGSICEQKQLEKFDEIFIAGMSIIYLGDRIAIQGCNFEKGLLANNGWDYKLPCMPTSSDDVFVRSPRIVPILEKYVVEIDAPPKKRATEQLPFLLTVGPSATMSLVMLASLGLTVSSAIGSNNMPRAIAGGIMAGGMLLGAWLWPTLLRKHHIKCIENEERERKARYEGYVGNIENDVISNNNTKIELLNNVIYQEPNKLCGFLDSKSDMLHMWERSILDSDFLDVRVGKGFIKSDIEFKIPRNNFSIEDDQLAEYPAKIKNQYSKLKNAPITVDLYNNRYIGIIGDDNNINDLLDVIVLNIIALHAYDEVKICLFSPSSDKFKLTKYKNIPHIWSNDKKVRFFATSQDEVHYVIGNIDEVVRERTEARTRDKRFIPHFVIIVTDEKLVEKEYLLRYISGEAKNIGVTVIFAYGDIAKIPKECTTVVQSNQNGSGYYSRNGETNVYVPFETDVVDENAISSFVKKLSLLPVKRDWRTLSIPDKVSFLQMYRVGNADQLKIEEHWNNNNSENTLAAPVGVMASGGIFSLDIHESYHGCHGLVAGTTGSGKSEFLQAYVLSMSIKYSPNEVAFVLVDFKGGDMARPFMAKANTPALPHLAATISNLSGNILYRALLSLEAEIKYRQKLFNEAAAELSIDKLDINSYQRYYKAGRLKTALPHLVIIIDEFAQLKTQHPEFLEQLVNVAQVGRSLGIHLILATQKPSGVVSPQIMSNSRFKVCLKVAEKQDSTDIIKRPDAALIKNPGRLYLKVGYDEIYECIQSGYSGANYVPSDKYVTDEEILVQMTDCVGREISSAKKEASELKSEKSQLEAIVADIIAIGAKNKLSVKPLWLDVLPDKLMLNKLGLGTKGLATATLGLLDFVRTQEQKPFVIDLLQTGHIGIYGASGTGKTTFLQTMVYSMVCDYGYTPDELQIYAMDFGGRNLGYFKNLPHTGEVVFANEEAKINSLITLLYDIIEERKMLFEANNCSGFADYRAQEGKNLPCILVMIDNYASFREKYTSFSEKIVELIAVGKAFGVFFVITGNARNAIHYRVAEYISTFLTLRMNDPGNYIDILKVRPPIKPDNINGRGIMLVGKEVIEFQIAVAGADIKETERLEGIKIRYQEISASWHGNKPLQVDGAEFNQSSGSQSSLNHSYMTLKPLEDSSNFLVLAESKSGLQKFGIDLSSEFKVCVSGKDHQDLAKYYDKFLLNINCFNERRVVVIDGADGFMKNIVDGIDGCTYINDVERLNLFFEKLKSELNERMIDISKTNDKLFIIITEFNDVFAMITDEQAMLLRKICKYINHAQYGVYFVSGFIAYGSACLDSLFIDLVKQADNYVIGEYCFEQLCKKGIKVPLVSVSKQSKAMVCIKDSFAEIRW